MTRAQAFKKVWNLFEKDDCKQAEEIAWKFDIEINYDHASEGRIYIDDECMMFEVDD